MAHYSLAVSYYLVTYRTGSFTILPQGLRIQLKTDSENEITLTWPNANPKATAHSNFLFLRLP